MKNFIFLLFSLIIGFIPLSGQNDIRIDLDEGDADQFNEIFLHKVKQIKQFKNRFNGVEEFDGSEAINMTDEKRYYLIESLFDTNYLLSKNGLVSTFIKDITNNFKTEPLNLETNSWGAEVSCLVDYRGEEKEICIYLQREHVNDAYFWTIRNIEADFLQLESPKEKYFIASNSHEMNFNHLKRAINDNSKHPLSYVGSRVEYDVISSFMFLVAVNDIKIKEISNVNFFFFQFPKWIFKVERRIRQNNNSGWLITELLEVNAKEKAAFLKEQFQLEL